MIVVTGATGQLGRLVIAELLKKVPAANVVAAVRNIEKAKDIAALGVQVRHADYDQPASWDGALKGADKVLLISSSEIGKRAPQHKAVIEAAARAGVKLLAYTSILRADTSPLGLAAEHKATEAMIRASGLPHAFLRNGWYLENYQHPIHVAVEHGAVHGCAGNGKISAASRLDYAAAAAEVLVGNKQGVFELAGDKAFTLSDLAAEISRQSGKSIGYVNLTEPEFRDALLKAGLPLPFAELLADSDTGISRGDLFDNGGQLGKLIGRPTMPLADGVAAALKG
ncbi:MAG: SDR family oxidoreductase [Gallionellaceae bacterium]|jgi:NAD(P)H dehydrogenase (quinone)|nr:SDR family oxidoreductase [Gallionellaceae bacterium]